MKRIICIVLCLLMIAASFAGCAEKKTMTFREAVEAGKEFIKNDTFKDVKYVTEADGTKVILEGKYDPKNEKAVFSVTVDTKDTTQTYKDMLKLDGKKLYIRIPDMSGFGNVFSSILPVGRAAEYDKSDNEIEGLINSVEGLGDWTEILGAYGVGDDDVEDDGITGFYGFDITDTLSGLGADLTDQIAGKYIIINLPENKPQTLKEIVSGAEDDVYEKAEKLESEEDYPNVVRYTQQSAYDLMITVLDGIREKRTDIASEFAALIFEYLGEENCKTLEDLSGKSVEDYISEGISEFFKQVYPDDIAPEDAEKFDVIQKIAYDTDKKLEYVFLYDLKCGDESHSVTTTLTVTALEEDAAFAEKCAVTEDEIFDLVGYAENILNNLKLFSGLKDMFKG